MVALKTERRVYMWRAMPRPVPAEAPVTVDLPEIIGILKGAHAAETAEIYLTDEGRILADDAPAKDKDRKNRVYISDLEEDANVVTLLINRGDPFVAEPAFIDATTEEVRTVAPEPNESQGWSAHLVIAKKAQKDGTHRACFERMPHSTSSYAEALLRIILERFAKNKLKYQFKKHVRKGRKVTEETFAYRPLLSVKKVPSEVIKDDLKKGELSSITLIDTKAEYGGPDAPDIVKSVSKQLVFKAKKADQKTVSAFLSKLAPWAREEGFDEIQIKITDLPGNTSVSPRFSLEKEDAMETLYVRTQRLLDFGVPLESCYAKISPEIRGKMIELIDDNGKW